MAKATTGQINYTNDEDLYKECVRIAERLKQTIVEHIDAIQANSNDKDFVLLAKSIKESIEKNEPEAALDRLYTFVVKYVRQLCVNHGVFNDKEEALNSIFGKYIKYLSTNNLLDSVMAEKILRYSINVIEAFNDVRNNKSFAHDNPILNYHESILIFGNISNTIKFIETVENKIQKTMQSQDLPF